MNIVHVVNRLDPAQGGPPRSALGLCQAMARQGHRMTILARAAAGFEDEQLNQAHASGGVLRTVVSPSRRILAGEIGTDTDVVHFHSVWRPTTAILARHCRRNRVPYVIAPRGELDRWSMQQKTLKKRLHLALVGRALVRRAGALHLLNEPELAGLEGLGLSGRYFICPNGADPDEWASVAQLRGAFRNRLGIAAKDVMLLFFARLHHKKGVRLLAPAFERAAREDSRLHLVLAGPDYGEAAWLRDRLQGLVSDGRVHIVGMLDGEDRRAAMTDADVFVLPSYQEGHPRGVIEAALAGKALLLSPFCNCPEFGDRESAYIVPMNEAALADGIIELARSPELRAELATTARRIAARTLTWEAIGRRMAEHYQSLVDAPEQLNCL